MDRHGCNSLASPSCSTISQAHQGCGPSTPWFRCLEPRDGGMTSSPYRMRAMETLTNLGGPQVVYPPYLKATYEDRPHGKPTPGSRLKGAAYAGGVPKFAGPVLDGLLGVHHGAVREPKVFRCHGKTIRDLIPSEAVRFISSCGCLPATRRDMAMD